MEHDGFGDGIYSVGQGMCSIQCEIIRRISSGVMQADSYLRKF